MKKVNTNGLDNFFSYVSKAVIIIPIFIFVFSLMFKFGQIKNVSLPSNSNCTGQACLTPTATPVINKIPIDLIGPWVCVYQDGLKQYTLSIKNKNVVLQTKENGQTKKQDLSSYVPYVEGFLNTDISVLENMINQYSGKKINLKEVLKSCKKEA